MGFEVKKEEETKARRIQDIQDEFRHFVENIEENTVLTGIPVLDKAMPITIGMNLGIVGAASSGKTALALEILKNTSKAGIVSVFASLDMHRNRLFEKLLYKTTGLSRGDLYAKVQAGEIEEITKKIKEDYSNVWFYDRSCPTVGNIREYIEEVEAETGKKVKLVMLDYFERVNSEKSEDTAASKDIAGQLQDLVNDFNVAMVTLVQPNKFSLGSGPDKPIKSYTAIKGSSFLYQSFRSIISIWRPFFTPETADKDRFLQMAILKNDLGELGMFNFAWSGKRGEIREATEEEEAELNYLLEQKKAAEANSKADSGWE
jgi:replicative DNA helicase